MKNVEFLSDTLPVFRAKLDGAPLPKGWALRYLSGIDDPEIKPGFWLSAWNLESDGKSVFFKFEPGGPYRTFNDEAVAKEVEAVFKEQLEIETEVVRLP